MQEVKNRRRIPRSRSGASKRNARPKTLRKPRTERESSPAIISDGIYSLKLKPLPVVKGIDKAIRDLHPAYLRFLELLNVEPKPLPLDLEVSTMYDHLEELTKEIMLDIYKTDEGDYRFIYVHPMAGDIDEYSTIEYLSVEKLIIDDRPHFILYQKTLRLLMDIGVDLWDLYSETAIEWSEERYGIIEHGEDYLGEEIQSDDFNELKIRYESGEAYHAIQCIRFQLPLNESDLMMEGLDPQHPVCRLAKELLDIYVEGKSLHDFSESSPDQGHDYYLPFCDTFCVAFDYDDDIWDEWEDYINTLADEGVSGPRLIVEITADMPVIPKVDSFPAQMIDLFRRFRYLAGLVDNYLKRKEVIDGKLH